MFKKLDLKTNIAKFDKNRDISKIKNDEFNLPLVNAKHGDNGIMYYGRKKDWQCCDMCIDIVNDGAVSTGDVYAQPQETGVLYNAYLIKPKIDKKSRYHLLFYSRCIEKTIKLKYGYENKAGWGKIKNDIIQLPKKNNQIDFEFMESFVAELEAQRVAELEAYLIASGLDDYELTLHEINLLNWFDKVEWGKFNLKDLFGKATRGKRLKSADRIAGNLPFVTAGETDEGVSAYIGNKVEVFNENTTTIDMFGSAKYRNYKYGADDHVAVVHTENVPKLASIFITSAIHKAAYTGEFNYGKNFYAKDADALSVMLPIKNGLPDYNYMEMIISYVQKLVIKDVVDYADNKIEKTKQVVNYK